MHKHIFHYFFILFLFFFSMTGCTRVEPTLKVTPKNLYFEKDETKKEFKIQNVSHAKGFFRKGIGPLNYTLETDDDYNWFSVHPTAGTSEGESDTIVVEVDRDKLDIGNNIARIIVASNAGDEHVTIAAEREKEQITTLSPNTGASLSINEEIIIRWTATPGVSNSVNILLYSEGSMVDTIASNYKYRNDDESPGEYRWTPKKMKGIKQGEYSLKIEDAINTEIVAEVSPINLYSPITNIRIKNIQSAHQIPSTIQFIFSLREQNNHAIILDRSEISWKDIKVWENNKEIDYSESHAQFYTQEDFQLKLLLVLDFSASMRKFDKDMKTLIQGAKSLIESLNETHQIAIIEFHGPGKPPTIIQPFTTNKKKGIAAIEDFSSTEMYNDFSTCWDAVRMGLNQFSTDPDPNIFRTLVLISDGFDNSSVSQPPELISLAEERDVHIYCMELGKYGEKKSLREISDETGGTYHNAKSISDFQKSFEQLKEDLSGQYKISYITPKIPADGQFSLKIKQTYNGITFEPPLEDRIDPSSIFGNTKEGIITFSATFEDQRAEIFMWCEHAPRYIHELRFRLDINNPHHVSLTSADNGGVCDGWTIKKEQNNWYRLISPYSKNPNYDLTFGTFGTICKIIIEEIQDEELRIPFKMDNSLYNLGQSFSCKDSAQVDIEGDKDMQIVIKSGE